MNQSNHARKIVEAAEGSDASTLDATLADLRASARDIARAYALSLKENGPEATRLILNTRLQVALVDEHVAAQRRMGWTINVLTAVLVVFGGIDIWLRSEVVQMSLNLVAIIYWIVALCASGWIGWYALTIFSVESPNRPQLWQQRLLNFVGSLIGWLVLWPLGVRYWSCLSVAGCPNVTLGWWSVFAGFIALIGITGYLPYTVIGLINAVLQTGKILVQIADKYLTP